MRTLWRRLAISLLLAPTALPVWAQSDLQTLSAHAGPDRLARLIEGARKEGSLTLYTSIAAPNLAKITADFEQRYGVKLEAWRAGTDKVLQRVLSETRAGRFDFDAVNMSSPEVEALRREGLLQPVVSPHHQDLIAQGLADDKAWALTYINVWVQAYNTDKVRKAELPRRYADLLDPRWKGRLGIESKNQEWFATVVKEMGEEQGLRFFRRLVATNGISVRTGHSLLNNLVVSGEVPLALTVYSFMPEQAKEKGAPIEWFALEPAIATSFAIGLSRRPRHPHAALLFYDYMLSEAQKLMPSMNVVPSSRKVESPVKGVKVKLGDPRTTLDEYAKWQKLYEEIVLQQGAK